MARPIQATPKLGRADTVSFLNRLYDERNDIEVINLGESVRKVRGKRDARRVSKK